MDTRSKVTELLKAYPSKKRQIEQLKIELEHPARVSDKEIIDSLSFGGQAPGEAGGRNGHISNKTMMIALQYRDVMQRINSDAIIQITQELHALEAEVARLERYVSLLTRRQQEVIRLYYFEGNNWTVLEDRLHLARRTLFKHRDEALDELAAMFQFIEQVKSVPEAQE